MTSTPWLAASGKIVANLRESFKKVFFGRRLSFIAAELGRPSREVVRVMGDGEAGRSKGDGTSRLGWRRALLSMLPNQLRSTPS